MTPIMLIECANLSPALLMQPAELRQVKRYLKQLEKHHEARHLDETKPKVAQLEFEVWRVERNSIDVKIDLLAAAVLQRELGLEKYMVIHVFRSDGHEALFQALSFGFHFGWRSSGRLPWMWEIRGRKLRKDGTLGCLNDGMSFDTGWIKRRKLDGSWAQLTLSSTNGVKNASHSK